MKTLEDLKNSQNHILVMHYACTVFDESPDKVTSISVKVYSSTQPYSFSINEDTDEKQVLQEFINFMKNHQNYIIVTWNQNSSKYGPQYLKNRCTKLGITDFSLGLEDVIDLDEVFEKKYGMHYVSHPKFRTLSELNKITLNDFVDGKKEPELFENKQYSKLQHSTERKVKVITAFLKLAFDDKLKLEKTESSITSIHNKDFQEPYGEKEYSLNKKSLIVAIIIGIIAFATLLFLIYTYYHPFEIKNDQHSILSIYSDGQPYSLRWTDCGVPTYITSSNGEKNIVSLTLKPIILDKNGNPSHIPFNVSYQFRIDDIWFGEPRQIDSISVLGHLVYPENRKPIMLNMTTALHYQNNTESGKIRLLLVGVSFAPYSNQTGNTLLDLPYDKSEHLVTELMYLPGLDYWVREDTNNSICHSLFQL